MDYDKQILSLQYLMQQEHSKVMHGIGAIEATLLSMQDTLAATREDLGNTQERLAILTQEVRNYRSYFLGFMAAISLVTSAVWALFTYSGKV